jgi:hypothetical protein
MLHDWKIKLSQQYMATLRQITITTHSLKLSQTQITTTAQNVISLHNVGMGRFDIQKMEGIQDMSLKWNVPINAQPSLVDIFDLLFLKQFLVIFLVEMLENTHRAWLHIITGYPLMVWYLVLDSNDSWTSKCGVLK